MNANNIKTENMFESVVKRPFTTIELFAGAGGLALGIEKAGFNTLALVEIDKDAADTLKANRPNWYVINDDISNISFQNLLYFFNLKKVNWIYSQEALHASLFPMPEKDLG